MGRGRYSNNEVVNGALGTWRDPVDAMGPGILAGVPTVEHVLVVGERLDTLAARYLGDDQLYWVLALCNGIMDPFSIEPGQSIQVPLDIDRVLSRLQR